MQFTRFPGRRTTGGTTHGVYLLQGEFFGFHSASTINGRGKEENIMPGISNDEFMAEKITRTKLTLRLWRLLICLASAQVVPTGSDKQG